MTLEEAAAEELEAIEAIMGSDCCRRDPDRPAACVLRITPEFDSQAETAGTLGLSVVLPPTYPSSAPARICVLSSEELGRLAPALAMGELDWQPSTVDRADLATAVATVTDGRPGEPTVFDAVEAVRQWLETNTLSTRVVPTSEGAEVAAEQPSEDDCELDDEDMDGEMVEALRPVLRGDGKRLRALEEAAALKDGSKEQLVALKALWRSLTAAQKAQMVESSDEEDAAPARGGGGKRGGDYPKRPPPPAKRECPKRHALTAVNAKPADYVKLEGNEFNCDVCGRDGKYSGGAYHCSVCRNWDCCVTCGSNAAGANAPTGGGRSGKSKKGKR